VNAPGLMSVKHPEVKGVASGGRRAFASSIHVRAPVPRKWRRTVSVGPGRSGTGFRVGLPLFRPLRLASVDPVDTPRTFSSFHL